MPDAKKLDPTGERAAATEAMETTPISGKEHAYRADGDHHPRQDAAAIDGADADADGLDTPGLGAAPKAEVPAERHISQGIPGAGGLPETDPAPDGERERGPHT
ncbi:hypothetical protein [Pseudorhodoferax sp. Leaf267]|uniref:hypothetical protein n=1 Tax=Pseudorhodoferax sp. Leaf267 TaxID=1736316 RepID=UPI0006FD4018|nr:hypothetical protein [Pseudorhodoferax sp. Leaf267]KQP20073.1 hypothetical protein ASF43_28355 [Pseudorhodoferax sp. Leaf267]